MSNPTVVERVADALVPFFSAADKAYGEHINAALAALEALRVPSEGMIWAFDDEMPEPTQEHYEHADLRRAYEALIDAAISEHKGK